MAVPWHAPAAPGRLSSDSGLVAWAERSGGRRGGGPARAGLRFAFYGRVSTEDWQDPVTSRARQREQAGALARGHGVIVAEFFDVGESRSVAWGRRPQAAMLISQLADPGRGWHAVVTSQTALVLAPVLALAIIVAIATGEVRYRIPFDVFFITVVCARASGDLARVDGPDDSRA